MKIFIVGFAVALSLALGAPSHAWIAQHSNIGDTWASAALGTAPPTNSTKVFVRNLTTQQNYFATGSDTVTDANAAASLTKMATAVIAAREVQYGVVAMSSTTTVLTGENVAGSSCTLQVGDTLTLAALLHCLLLPSGNDAAEVIARFIGTAIRTRTGSGNTGRVRFVEAMNALATEIGAANTVFQSPHGVQYTPSHTDNDANTTTARDMGRILNIAFYDAGTQALTTPSLRTIAGTASYSVVITGANARTYSIDHISVLVAPSKDGYLVAAKTGTSTAPIVYSVAALWQAPNGNWIETIVLAGSTSGNRNADARGLWYEAISDWPTLAGTVGTDSLFASVLLLTGADPGFTDESPAARTLTNVSATRTTTEPIVGTHSYSFNGTSAYLWAADAADLAIGSSDLCVELWFRGNGTAPSGNVALASKYNAVSSLREWVILYAGVTPAFFFYSSADGTTFANGTLTLSDMGYTAAVLFNGAEHNITACRAGGTLDIYLDGTRGLTRGTFASAYFDGSSRLEIGARASGASSAEYFFPGVIDEARVTKASRGFTTDKISVIPKAFPRSGP